MIRNIRLILFFAWLCSVCQVTLGQTECIDGKAGEYACKDVNLLSHMHRTELGGDGTLADNWGWKDPQTGRYYAITTSSTLTSFVDVTDPVNPVYLGKMLSVTKETVPRDVKTYANHAFVVGDEPGHGMQVFDLTRLRGVDDPQTFSADAWYPGPGRSHNIAINEETGFAYLLRGGTAAGLYPCNQGLHIVDISTPKSPFQVGCWGDTGRIHDAQCVIYKGPDENHQGSEICFASNNPNLSIIDVSDKNNIRLLSQSTYPELRYPHQGWLSEDQRFFLMGDEADENRGGLNTRTIIFDVSDLEQPVYAGSHLADTLSIDHNQYIKGNYVYQANTSSGMRILRIDNLPTAELTEVAWFDTFPQSNSVIDWTGAWNVYPFFDNGTLLVSDHLNGLFILRAGVGNNFQINAGLNDAWVSADAPFQGFFFTVFPDLGIFFLSWFTFDSTPPADGTSAVFGAVDQRWVTGAGTFSGNSVTVNVELTSGGIFNASEPLATQQPGYGTLTIVFNNCNEAVLTYNFPSAGLSGQMTLTRVVPSNVALCESLSTP
jgi:choice-of-anchor B domain-containing protein